jgi:prepilin-type N-terminal cleavage/methylation domain-containing protein
MARAHGRAAFTLIEMMAAVMIFALLAGLVAPRMGVLSGRTLRERGERMAARIEFGRQRAAVTGRSHRLVIALDEGVYWLEEEGAQAATDGLAPLPVDASGRPLAVDAAGRPLAVDASGRPLTSVALDASGRPTPVLTPPPSRAGVWSPVQGVLGREEVLEDSLRVAALETAAGWIELGEAWIDLHRDGTASETWIHLEDDAGRKLVLEVRPLAEGVRIDDAEL